MATLSSPTLGKLITNVRNMLNQPNSANSFWTDYELTEYINEAVRMYFGEVVINNEGQFTTSVALDLVGGTETVALPTDFFEVRALYKRISNGYSILAYSNDGTMESYSTLGDGGSETYRPSYYFRDQNLVLRSPPQASETSGLLLEYVRFPDTMVNGGDVMSSQVSPVFKQLIEMYAVYKAKMKESLVNGINMQDGAKENLAQIYNQFKDIIRNRSKYPSYVAAFNPEY